MTRQEAQEIVEEIAKEYGLTDAQKEYGVQDYMQRDVETLEYIETSEIYIDNLSIISTLPKN